MTTTDSLLAQCQADQFGRAVARRLSSATDELPHDIRERLRAARVRALAVRKTPATAPVVIGRGGAATLGFGEGSLFSRIASIVPLLVLAGGLVLIHVSQAEGRASELAEVDAALLTDDLPPAAYADPGFVQFLKTGRGE
jgi:hypothetical protein